MFGLFLFTFAASAGFVKKINVLESNEGKSYEKILEGNCFQSVDKYEKMV